MVDPRIAAILEKSGKPIEIPASDDRGMDWVSMRALARKPKARSEISRICNLPICTPLDPEEFEEINLMHLKPEAIRDGFLLEEGQAEAIAAFQENDGLFAPLPVGSGKTLISLRCIGIATEKGVERSVLFVPPEVYAQLVQRDIAWVRKRLPLGCTFYKMGGLGPERRMALAGGGRRGCWIIPYSLLSRPDSYDLLVKIQPELMVFDEAHMLKNKGSARTKRILTFYEKYRPRCVFLSGTMTAKSIKDYAHLMVMALREGACLPLDQNIVQEWSAVLDSEQKGTDDWHQKTAGPGPLRPLISWSNVNFPETQLPHDVSGFRRAYLNRLSTTPGVVNRAGKGIPCSLIFTNVKADRLAAPGGAQLDELVEKLNNEWVTPVGDELEHAMTVWKWNYELTAGIYNARPWPSIEDLMERHRWDGNTAKQVLAASQEYHTNLQLYHKELRNWFKTFKHKPGLDTPMTVAGDMKRNGCENVSRDLYEAWVTKEQSDFAQRVERDKIPVRVCPYKVIEAVKWAKRQKSAGGIIWYYNQALGDWIYEEMVNAGLPTVHCVAGPKMNKLLTADNAVEMFAGKFLVASVSAHGTGKNLQHFMQNQIFVQLPPTEQRTEQSVGRTHRRGQLADEVTVTTLISNTYDEMALAALLNDAMYVRETMDDPRKLLVGTWNPMPIVYGSHLLIRAGANAKMLNARQQQLLQERFDEFADK